MKNKNRRPVRSADLLFNPFLLTMRSALRSRLLSVILYFINTNFCTAM
ncbi:MAG: hypothetical protein ABH878_03915 [bacterium]